MNQSLVIQEQYSPIWKYVAIVSAVLAVLLFMLYWNMTDVFWAGMVRLASFVSLAGSIMSGLKSMENGLNVEVSTTGKTLDFIYYKKGNSVREHSQELKDVKSVTRVKSESRFTGVHGNVFIIRFKDSDQDFDLFHFGGRTLQFDDTESDKLIDFFRKHSIPFNDGTKTSNT